MTQQSEEPDVGQAVTEEPLHLTCVEPIAWTRTLDHLGHYDWGHVYARSSEGERLHRLLERHIGDAVLPKREAVHAALQINYATFMEMVHGMWSCDWAEAKRRLRAYAAKVKP